MIFVIFCHLNANEIKTNEMIYLPRIDSLMLQISSLYSSKEEKEKRARCALKRLIIRFIAFNV